MAKIKQYKKTARVESAIVEEKVDGSNFCWLVDESGLRFFSRQYEIKLGDYDFYDEFITFITKKHEVVPFVQDIKYFAEAIGQANIDYKQTDTFNKLYVFDIKGTSGMFYKRNYMEKLCMKHGLNIVPLTTLNNEYSVINPSVKREGVILRYENLSGLGSEVVKLKWVQNVPKDKDISPWKLSEVK